MKFLNSIANMAASRKRAWTVIAAWLVIVILLSAVAPASKPYAVTTGEGSAFNPALAEQAQDLMRAAYPNEEGTTALYVFHREGGLTEQDLAGIIEWSEWLASDERPSQVVSSVPYHQLPPQVQESMLSEDHSTLLFSLSLTKGLDTKVMGKVLDGIKDEAVSHVPAGLELNVTGPAGIAADTSRLFANADFVLMAATVVLILVMLIVIYRSPLLAILPLLIAGIVYQAVDRTIGLLGEQGLMTVDRSAMSIMLVLLFAVLTDYSLFIFSRFREELRHHESPFHAMQAAVRGVAEAIMFSGGTVLFAMLALFGAVFNPYHAFASVFSIAIVWMLLAGLTLIPAVFAVAGRVSFWPFTARVRFVPEKDGAEGRAESHGIWTKLSHVIGKRPRTLSAILLIILMGFTVFSSQIQYSYNLLHSFPDTMSARQGFDQLAESFPPGELAPVTVLLETTADKKGKDEKQLLKLEEQINKWDQVESFTWKRTKGNPAEQKLAWSEDQPVLAGELVLTDDPYSVESISALTKWRDNATSIIQGAGLSVNDYSLHFAGQTADQADVKQMNARDTIYLFAVITAALLVMLTVLTRSIWTSIMMTGTMLLSFGTTLGVGWLFFHNVLGLDAISYRLPVYTFLFMVALGVDYSIMMVTRIREEARVYPWREAVEHGVAKTGGVISSAGIILAATFGVLITQPLQELMLFGGMMVFGILLDTFIIRGILLPSLFIGYDKLFRPSPRREAASKSSTTTL